MYKRFRFDRETSMFGTRVQIHLKDGSQNELLVENMEFDPIKRLSPRLRSGYFFRSPGIKPDQWESVFKTLEQIAGKINIWAEYDTKTEKTTAYAIVEDRSDAAMWAWATVETFQKWSVEKQKEARAEAREKPQRVKINPDGTVTVKVTSVSIAPSETEDD